MPTIFSRAERGLTTISWGLSSAGRASALQAEGRRFDPDRLHHLVRAGRGRYRLVADLSADGGVAKRLPDLQTVLIDEGSTFLVLAGIRPAVSMAPATASLTS